MVPRRIAMITNQSHGIIFGLASVIIKIYIGRDVQKAERTVLGAVGKKKKLRRVTQTYLFRCRIAVGIDPRAPFLSILPRKPLKCGKTAKMAVLRDLASWQLRGLK